MNALLSVKNIAEFIYFYLHYVNYVVFLKVNTSQLPVIDEIIGEGVRKIYRSMSFLQNYQANIVKNLRKKSIKI